ncbi:hypothetical protein LTR95_016976 [Oleoguttula sp. CCFEE 5521]
MPSTHPADQTSSAALCGGRSIDNLAPYHRNEGAYEDHYIIEFKRGHTLAQHFVFVGKRFEIEGTLDEGYYAKLDRELLDAVRRDPGVEFIEDDTLVEVPETYDPPEEDLEQAPHEEEDEQECEKSSSLPGKSVTAVQPSQDARAAYQAPYNQAEFPYHDHYIIAFRPGHTLAAHFAFVGKEFDIQGELDEGYYAKLDSELFGLVRQDPGVSLVEDDGLGEFGPTEEELERSRLEDEEGRDMCSPHEADSQTAIPLDKVIPTGYQAPYNRLSGYPYKDCYTVEFKPGHTMAEHFAFVGKEYEFQEATSTWYYAKLDLELFEAVRRDPGVEMVEDDPLEGEEGGSFGPTEEELEEARLADEEKRRAAGEK